MSAEIACPACSYEFDLLAVVKDEADQKAVNAFMHTCVPGISDRMLRYTLLFKTPKHAMTMRKQLKLVTPMLPDIDRRAISWKGRDLAAPLAHWAEAIDQMLAAAQAGRLELPMRNHNYLFSVLAGMADKVDATAEAKREEDARLRPRRDTVQVRGQTMEIGTALDVVYGGKDPALAAVDERNRNAAPMPEHLREKFAQIKKGQTPC
ncbi:MAG: hypothetical protein RSG22_04495 [Comamonas sp.]